MDEFHKADDRPHPTDPDRSFYREFSKQVMDFADAADAQGRRDWKVSELDKIFYKLQAEYDGGRTSPAKEAKLDDE